MNKIKIFAFSIVFVNTYQIQNHQKETERLLEVSSQFIRGGCSPFGGF